MITVFADKHLYNIEKFLPEEVEPVLYDPENGLPDNLADADALLIRTVTKINAETLPQVPDKLSFIGSGSAGTDHVDIGYLESHGVEFAHAPGSNARSVAEYVATSILAWCDYHNIRTESLRVGIVGAGNTGGALDSLLQRLGIETIKHDPPREIQDKNFYSSSLEEVLKCDVLSLHVPLTVTGKWKTFHWLDSKKLEHPFKLIVNTSRGGVIDETALYRAYQHEDVSSYILDVWENEPCFDDKIAKEAFIATPHIAGYSEQAKLRASKMIADSLLTYFSLAAPPEPSPDSCEAESLFSSLPSSLPDLLKELHPLFEYHERLKTLIELPDSDKAQQFQKLRTALPLRCEYPRLKVPGETARAHPLLSGLGLAVRD